MSFTRIHIQSHFHGAEKQECEVFWCCLDADVWDIFASTEYYLDEFDLY